MTNAKWHEQQIEALFALPFTELLHKAQTIHKDHFPINTMQLSNLCSIKTGNCPEDCRYCAQSGHYKTKITNSKLLAIDEIITAAKHAKKIGATRFCMSAAWKTPTKQDFAAVLAIITEVKKIPIETCVTLGMITSKQAIALKEAGLDYYNHNLNTSANYYPKIASTHSYQDRLDTIANIRAAKLKLCCGGIIGMGETRADRISLLLQLAKLAIPPESIPVNFFSPIANTPLENCPKLDNFEFIRVIAIIRLIFVNAVIRVAAGRKDMTDEMQALCFIAGANSIFIGEKLLTINNKTTTEDHKLLTRLSLNSQD